MTIRYFSNKTYGKDYRGRPTIDENVSAYADDGSGVRVPYGFMSVTHRTSGETPNFGENAEPTVPQPTELFKHRPALTTVKLAFVDPSIRHTIPIMGAYLSKKYGELTADSSLTSYSSELTHKAINKKLPIKPSPHNPGALPNDLPEGSSYTFDRRTQHVPTSSEDEIHKSEIYEAKNYLREMLGRKKPLSQQFAPAVEQPKLPGMENF